MNESKFTKKVNKKITTYTLKENPHKKWWEIPKRLKWNKEVLMSIPNGFVQKIRETHSKSSKIPQARGLLYLVTPLPNSYRGKKNRCILI